MQTISSCGDQRRWVMQLGAPNKLMQSELTTFELTTGKEMRRPVRRWQHSAADCSLKRSPGCRYSCRRERQGRKKSAPKHESLKIFVSRSHHDLFGHLVKRLGEVLRLWYFLFASIFEAADCFIAEVFPFCWGVLSPCSRVIVLHERRREEISFLVMSTVEISKSARRKDVEWKY